MNRSFRKIMYLVIAVVIALIYVSFDSCIKKDKVKHDRLSFRLDSLEYEYQVLLCRKDSVVSRIDTIRITQERVRVLTNRISAVKPIYNQDSITSLISTIIKEYNAIPEFQLLLSDPEEN